MSMMISARGLSLDAMTCSMMPTTGAVPRTVMVLAAAFATSCGCTGISGVLTMARSSSTSSSTFPCET